jgi:hypothetical protein
MINLHGPLLHFNTDKGVMYDHFTAIHVQNMYACHKKSSMEEVPKF